MYFFKGYKEYKLLFLTSIEKSDQLFLLKRLDIYSYCKCLIHTHLLTFIVNIIYFVTDSPPVPSRPPAPVTTPRSLQLISRHNTNNKQCVTAHHHSITGDILLGCQGGTKLYNRSNGNIATIVSCHAASATQHRGEVFISSRSSSEESMNVHRYHQRGQRRELLFSFPQKSRKSSYVSASCEYIAATGRDSNDIKLYDRKSKVVSALQPVGLKVVFSLHFSPDGGLLVTGHDNVKDIIIKYRISGEGGLELVWSCDQVAGACGVTTDDETGLIYVCGQKNKTIYVLSAEGAM